MIILQILLIFLPTNKFYHAKTRGRENVKKRFLDYIINSEAVKYFFFWGETLSGSSHFQILYTIMSNLYVIIPKSQQMRCTYQLLR